MTIVMLKAAATAPFFFLTFHVRYVMVFGCVPSFPPSISFHPILLPFGVVVVVVGGCTHFPLHLVPHLPLLLSLSPPPHPLHSSPHYSPPPPPVLLLLANSAFTLLPPISLHYPPPPPISLFSLPCAVTLHHCLYVHVTVNCFTQWRPSCVTTLGMLPKHQSLTWHQFLQIRLFEEKYDLSWCNVTVTVIKLDVTKIMQSCLSCFTSNMSQQSWQSLTSNPPPHHPPTTFFFVCW